MAQPDITAQVDALRKELGSLAELFSKFAEENRAAMSAAVSRGASEAKRKVADVAGQTAGLAEAASAQAGDIQESLEKYVVANPLRAVMIAAGVGLLLGAMSRR